VISRQLQNMFIRYGVDSEKELLQRLAEEYTEMTLDPGDPPYRARDMEAILDQMLEAEYQRIEGGAYDPINEPEELDDEFFEEGWE
jgi:hypothetical protein